MLDDPNRIKTVTLFKPHLCQKGNSEREHYSMGILRQEVILHTLINSSGVNESSPNSYTAYELMLAWNITKDAAHSSVWSPGRNAHKVEAAWYLGNSQWSAWVGGKMSPDPKTIEKFILKCQSLPLLPTMGLRWVWLQSKALKVGTMNSSLWDGGLAIDGSPVWI